MRSSFYRCQVFNVTLFVKFEKTVRDRNNSDHSGQGVTFLREKIVSYSIQKTLNYIEIASSKP